MKDFTTFDVLLCGVKFLSAYSLPFSSWQAYPTTTVVIIVWSHNKVVQWLDCDRQCVDREGDIP